MDIQHGYFRWKIYRWNDHPNPFRGRQDLALTWLRRFQSDRLVMTELRALIERGRGSGYRLASDAQLLEEIAEGLSTGEFYVCAEASHPFHVAETEVVPPDPDSEALAAVEQAPAPAAAAPPPAPAEAPADAQDAPTLPPEADAEAIAQSLQQAAETGKPFCEECQKAKAAQAAPAPATAAQEEPQDTFGPNTDSDAIARNLTSAAQDGAPFCEECERARQAEAAQREMANA
jgi:hypothetical protein